MQAAAPPPRRVMQAQLQPEDVVCGRGDQHVAAAGNARFYRLIDDHLEHYLSADTKFEKSRVVLTIFTAIAPGRFLKKRTNNNNNNNNNQDPPDEQDQEHDDEAGHDVYVRMHDKEARQKISHALRYRLKARHAALLAAAAIMQDDDADQAAQDPPQGEQEQAQQEPETYAAALPAPPRAAHGRVGSPSNGLFSDGDLFSVLGDPSIFQSTQTMSVDTLMQLFRQDGQTIEAATTTTTYTSSSSSSPPSAFPVGPSSRHASSHCTLAQAQQQQAMPSRFATRTISGGYYDDPNHSITPLVPPPQGFPLPLSDDFFRTPMHVFSYTQHAFSEDDNDDAKPPSVPR